MKTTKAQLKKAIEAAGGTLESDGESFNACERLQAVAPEGKRWADGSDSLGSFVIAWALPGFYKRDEFNARELADLKTRMADGTVDE